MEGSATLLKSGKVLVGFSSSLREGSELQHFTAASEMNSSEINNQSNNQSTLICKADTQTIKNHLTFFHFPYLTIETMPLPVLDPHGWRSMIICLQLPHPTTLSVYIRIT